MRVIDSCGWLEFFKGTALGAEYRPHALAADVVVPTVVLYEVYKLLRREASAQAAATAAADMRTSLVVELDETLALLAADLSLEHRLAMADAIVYATAVQFEAELVTSDADLQGLPGVVFLPRSS